MKFALNYSHQAAALVKNGRIELDLFKCPAWPDMVAEAQTVLPAYVHFPLVAGNGSGTPEDGETGELVEWRKIDNLLAITDTAFINIHLDPTSDHFPGLDERDFSPATIAQITEHLIRDVEGLIRRYGPEKVIAENSGTFNPKQMLGGFRADVIRQVVEAAGCGFLFDISHARQVARGFEQDAYEYIAQLPVERTKEIHITGIQYFGDDWVQRLRDFGVADPTIARLARTWLDHLPLIEADWPVMAWAKGQIEAGLWGDPQVIAVEVGGEGEKSFWQATTDPESLAEQIPRLRGIFA